MQGFEEYVSVGSHYDEKKLMEVLFMIMAAREIEIDDLFLYCRKYEDIGTDVDLEIYDLTFPPNDSQIIKSGLLVRTVRQSAGIVDVISALDLKLKNKELLKNE